MSRKITTEEFICRSKKAHGDKYDYSLAEYIKYDQKLKIICAIHGVFEQVPYDHVRGKGCKKCANTSRNLNTKDFIKKSKSIHEDKYDYSEVSYINNQTKVKIICDLHGAFYQRPSNHFEGRGCAKCGRIKNDKNRTYTTEQFIQLANKVHNNKYNYSLVKYEHSTKKIKIICPIHGVFKQIAGGHLKGCGCYQCRSLYDNKKFIELATKIHGNTYDYSKIKYEKSSKKIEIICKVHGSFWQIPASHLSGHGCSLCAAKYRAELLKTTEKDFIDKSKNIHDNKYDYSLVNYENCDTKIVIICPKHGKFKQTPYSHLNCKQGCPKCIIRISKPEIEWLNLLGIPDDFEHRNVKIKINNKNFYVDGFIPEKKEVYEFNGDYFHGNPDKFDHNKMNKTTKCTFRELYEKTKEKSRLLKEAGYKVISIWENDFKKLQNSQDM